MNLIHKPLGNVVMKKIWDEVGFNLYCVIALCNCAFYAATIADDQML